MQTLTTADSNTTSKFKGLNRKVPPREQKARQYITESFTGKMPTLIPFALQNKSVIKLASYLLKHTTGSKHTLYQYVFGIYRFSKWINKQPDSITKEVIEDKNAIDRYIENIENFIGDLQAEDLAPGTINNHVKGVKALFRVNRINLQLPFRMRKTVRYPDRSPTPEELTKIIDIANLRDKVIVSILALSGIRIGTLVKLQYRHVKYDLENEIKPIHLHIEAEITKGKYHSYDTFIGKEAIKYLKTYINSRRIGNERLESGKKCGMPPETITDSTPLIRNSHKATVEAITPNAVHSIIHKLYRKADLIEKNGKVRYDLRAHSIRKYFKTQLGANSKIPADYVEYMMGHTISTYNDVQMKGIAFLRNLYVSSGLSIRPKTTLSKIDRLKTFAESLGLNPDEVLSKDALIMPHRTVIDPEQRTIEILNKALKKEIIKELKTSILQQV